MPKLYVVPKEVFDSLHAEDVPLKVLTDIDSIVSNLSAQDIEDIHFATKEFPFKLDDVLEIEVVPSPYDQLMVSNNSNIHENMYNRVKERIDTSLIKGEDKEPNIPVYTFYPIDGENWVAVLQRQRKIADDPKKNLLSSNLAFFDGLIAQVLHTFPFHEMCKTNLFSYYLGAYQPDLGLEDT